MGAIELRTSVQSPGSSQGGRDVSVEAGGMVLARVAVAEDPHISFTSEPVMRIEGSAGCFMMEGRGVFVVM